MIIWYSFCQLPRWHRILLVLLTAMMIVLLLLPSDQTKSPKPTATQELAIGVAHPLKLDIDALRKKNASHTPENFTHETIFVQKGDNLSVIFKRLGFKPRVLFEIDKLGQKTRPLHKIHPGDTLTFYRYSDRSFRALSYPLDERQTLWVEFVRNEENYTVSVQEDDIETRLKFARGDITDNFWNAGLNAGLSESLIMGLAAIFGWDIDFVQDIRPKDRFTVIYEQHFKNAEFVKNGAIIAAEFVNQGEIFQAVRHNDEQYYAPDGSAMRKSFLRAPVNFKYISSNFNPRRLHPVTKRVRPHNGIDYAARIGTPVVAAGDGVVVAAGYNRYNGNYIFIKHSETYMTRYLHLNRRYVKKGTRVKQGKRIGSVGRTGLATGPHLHYEFLVNGTHRNPRTVKLPKAHSLKGHELKTFTTFATEMTKRLNQVEQVWFATVLRQ